MPELQEAPSRGRGRSSDGLAFPPRRPQHLRIYIGRPGSSARAFVSKVSEPVGLVCFPDASESLTVAVTASLSSAFEEPLDRSSATAFKSPFARRPPGPFGSSGRRGRAIYESAPCPSSVFAEEAPATVWGSRSVP